MDTERRMTTQEMLAQHKKLMDEAQRLEPSVMVTERNWSALLEMQDRLFRQQMQLDTDLKMLLTKAEAQESLIKMQTSAENFEKQAGSLSAGYSSACKELTDSTWVINVRYETTGAPPAAPGSPPPPGAPQSRSGGRGRNASGAYVDLVVNNYGGGDVGGSVKAGVLAAFRSL